MLHLRTYQGNDRAALLAIFDGNVPRYFAPAERALFEAFLLEPKGRFGVLTEGGSIVGCGGIWTSADGTSVSLNWGMIDRDQHRRGLGLWLTRERFRWIAALPNARQIILDTSQEAVGFYRKLGFEQTGVLEDHYGPGLHRHDLVLRIDAAFRARYSSTACS